VNAKTQRGGKDGADTAAGKRNTMWPLDVMKAAVAMIVDQGINAREVSRELNIPYTTVNEWARKYRAGGVQALAPRRVAAKPDTTRTRKPDARRQAVLAVKQAQPQAGSRRIRDVLKRFFGLGASETTVRRVLHEEGLAPKREAARRKPGARPSPVRFERAEPNQLWQSDLFTFLLRRQERVYVAAFMDDHSRYIVSLVMAHHQKSSLVMEALARGIADYGAPREILTDQGRQYTAWRGSTAFEEELRRNGIAHVKSRPHHPQTCGKIERFWKTMWDEFLSRTVFADFDDCQRRAALFVQHYNFQRPHQALEGLTPADRFFRSAPQVRAAVEATVAENALRLAREQPPRKPFYLVGRLGDRDIAINAMAGAVQVRVGSEQTTIPLAKESDYEEAASTVRWSGGRPTQEASSPSDSEVAEGPGALERGGAQPLHDGAVGALGRDAGDGGDRAGEDLARDLLPAGDSGVEGDALGAESARDRTEALAAGSLGHTHPGAHREGSPARAGQAQDEAAVTAGAQGTPSGCVGGAAGAPPAACTPGLDADWQAALCRFEAEGDGEPTAFDPDQDWRERVLIAERKLAGSDAAGDAAGGEERHGQAEEELYAGSERAAGDGAAHGYDPGGDRGPLERRSGGAHAGDVAQPLPDDPASRHGSAGGVDHAEGERTAAEAQTDRLARAGAASVASGECAPARAPRHDRPPAAGGERAAPGPDPAGASNATAQDGELAR
jgi:transposase InsO family protein